MSVEEDYRRRYGVVLRGLALSIETQLRDYMSDEPHIDRISARPKSIDRFVAKAAETKDGQLKYDAPLHQIQDQIGARIITLYLSDVERISGIIQKYYRPIETRHVVPESEWEFGYVGRHFILLIPDDVVEEGVDVSLVPKFFELQIKTLFQHAWSEANHDLGYKPGESPLSSDDKRKLAFAAAQAWGGDRMFDELFRSRSGAD